jgi:hypothetical protein
MTGDPQWRARDVAEMAEAVALIAAGFEALHRWRDRHAADPQHAEDRVADDPCFVAVWQKASFLARSELLTSMAQFAADGGVSADSMRPGSAARLLRAHTTDARRRFASASGAAPFGPLAGPAADYATELVGDTTITTERDKRLVFAALGLRAVALRARGGPDGE